MNKITLMGRIASDLELKNTPGGVPVLKFTIAVSRRFQKETTDFIRCTAWRQAAEFISKYFNKGSMLCVAGSLQVSQWEDKDQKKNISYDVVVDEAYFTGEKQQAEKPQTTPKPDFVELDDTEDLPF